MIDVPNSDVRAFANLQHAPIFTQAKCGCRISCDTGEAFFRRKFEQAGGQRHGCTQ